MPIIRQVPDMEKFNRDTALSYQLRLEDFGLVMQDVYDFFFDVNTHLLGKGIKRLDEMLRPAAMSGLISDMVAASMAQHSRVLVENRYHNGHPDLIVNGVYPNEMEPGTPGLERRRCWSVPKFEAALQPVQARLHGRDGSILRHFRVQEARHVEGNSCQSIKLRDRNPPKPSQLSRTCSHVRLNASHVGLKVRDVVRHRAELRLDRLQMLKQELVGNGFAHAAQPLLPAH